MPKIVICFITALLLLAPYAQANTDAAEAAALAWLDAIDSGEYELAWEESSPLLKSPLSPSMLERIISVVRATSGRWRQDAAHASSRKPLCPALPKMITKSSFYQTRFANKSDITETITPHFEDGVWKVSGYYVN